MDPRVGLDAVANRKIQNPCRESNLDRAARSPAATRTDPIPAPEQLKV